MKPALTREEWKEFVREGWVKIGVDLTVETSAHERSGFWICHSFGECAEPSKGKERHALAALCLYDQPFGFTREHVRALRDFGHYNQTSEDRNLALEALKLMEALLPPEE